MQLFMQIRFDVAQTVPTQNITNQTHLYWCGMWWRIVGRDGALVESIAFNLRVVHMGSTPALAVT